MKYSKDFLQNRSSEKFRSVHKKTPVLESLFNKENIANIMKLLGAAFFVEAPPLVASQPCRPLF